MQKHHHKTIIKTIKLIALIGIAALTWYANITFDEAVLEKSSYMFTAIAVSYLVFKLILEDLVSKRIKHSKARYSFRKTTNALFIIAVLLIVLRIWVIDPQALLVAYGLVAAGVAIALQDVFKNFAGALVIFMTRVYRVGDRIEVNGVYGDVIDIGFFYTSLIEIRQWVHGDQSTGRITILRNGVVLSSPINNYTKDHSFIWDEISLPITYDSNWKDAIARIQTIVEEKTVEATEKAEREISHLKERYYLSKRNIEPDIFVTPTDNWIMLHIRYVVSVRERRLTHNDLSQAILTEFEKMKDVTIASETLTVTNTQPKKKLK